MTAAERLAQIRAERAASSTSASSTAPKKTAAQRLAEIRAEKASAPQPTVAPAPKQSLPQKIGGGIMDAAKGVTKFFGAEGISEQYGASLARAIAPKKEKDFVEFPSEKRVLGSAIQSGANLIPGLGGAKLAGRIGVGAATGYGLDVGSKMQDDKTIPEILTPGVGTLVGAGLPIVGKSLGAIGKNVTESIPKQMINYSYRVPSKQAGKKLNEAILERGYGGKPLTEVKKLTTAEESVLEKQIQSRLTDKILTKTDDFVEQLASKLQKRTGSGITAADIKARVAKFVPDHANLVLKSELTEKEANTLRKALDRNLKEATFQGKELSNEQQVIKRFTDTLRSLVKDKTSTSDLFKKQSEAIGIKKLADQALDKIETQGRPGLLDIMSAGVGFGGGGLPGAALTLGVQRALRNPMVQGGMGQGLRNMKILGPAMKNTGTVLKKTIQAGSVQGD